MGLGFASVLPGFEICLGLRGSRALFFPRFQGLNGSGLSDWCFALSVVPYRGLRFGAS